MLSAHPRIYSVSGRLESPAVSATWYGHDYPRSFGRAHSEQPVSAMSRHKKPRLSGVVVLVKLPLSGLGLLSSMVADTRDAKA